MKIAYSECMGDDNAMYRDLSKPSTTLLTEWSDFGSTARNRNQA